MSFTECCKIVRDCVQRHLLIQSGTAVGRINVLPSVPPHESAFDESLLTLNSQSATQCWNGKGAHFSCECDALVCRSCKDYHEFSSNSEPPEAELKVELSLVLHLQSALVLLILLLMSMFYRAQIRMMPIGISTGG